MRAKLVIGAVLVAAGVSASTPSFAATDATTQHGFHCDERASFQKEASTLAWQRSLEFLAKHMK